MSTTTVYVLRLQGGRFYIGKSDNVIYRYQQHLNGSGSSWTRKYPPISLEKTIEKVSHFEEDKITKEYMAKYGIEKVRGGSYVEIELSDFQKDALNMEIWGAHNKCTQCGRAGHFVKDCKSKTDVSGNSLYQEPVREVALRQMVYRQLVPTRQTIVSCYRCGRAGNYSTTCYASTSVKKYADSYDSDSDDSYDSY